MIPHKILYNRFRYHTILEDERPPTHDNGLDVVDIDTRSLALRQGPGHSQSSVVVACIPDTTSSGEAGA